MTEKKNMKPKKKKFKKYNAIKDISPNQLNLFGDRPKQLEEERRLTKTEIKRQWHIDNKPIVFKYFNGVCQICKKDIKKGRKWDIHHFKYNYNLGLIYETPALELIKHDIITLICRPCHNKIHTADDPNNPQHLENAAYCEMCGRLSKNIIKRKKAKKLENLLCRGCLRKFKKIANQPTLF